MTKETWISINDGLPEYGVPVLVCDDKKGEQSVEICRLESTRVTKDNVSCEWLEGRHSDDQWYGDVTHWMPIPKTPQQ